MSHDKFNERLRDCISFAYSSVVSIQNSAAGVPEAKKVSSDFGGMKS